MWYLISTLNPDEKHVLLVGKEYLVGRKDCDIILAGDASVSRKHAILEVSHSETNLTDPNKVSSLLVKDISKYGVYINKVKVTDTEGQRLNDGDEVVFGTKLTYMVVYEPFIISMSCLDNAKKKTVRNLVCTLGGHVINEWQRDCSLLVMSSINVTIKVICAMVGLKHIVTTDYLEQYVKYLKGEADEPDPVKFLPAVSEAQIDPSEVSFKRYPKRNSVFKGMTFIFLSAKQYKKMNLAVELGGGMSMLMEENSGEDDQVLIQKGTVVMNCMVDSSTQSQIGQEWIQHVQKYLKRHKKHMIQDAELGYAVLYCSTEKHCNPDNDFLSQMMHKVPSQSLSQAEILAANTEATQVTSVNERSSSLPRRRHATNDPETINETKMAGADGKKKGDLPTDIKDEPLSQGHSSHTEPRSLVTSELSKQNKSSKRSPSPKPRNEKDRRPSEKSPSPLSRGSKKANKETRSKSRSPSTVPTTDRKTRSRSKSPAPLNRKQTPSTSSKNKRKSSSSDEIDSEFPFGRKVKQEIVAPTRSATKRGGRNIDSDIDIKSEVKSSQKKRNDSDDTSKNSNISESERTRQSVFDSIQFASQQKYKHEIQSHNKKIKVETFNDSDEDSRRKKKRKVFDDSDEDVVEIPKRKRRQEVEDNSDDEFFGPRKKRQFKQTVQEDNQKSGNKTREKIDDFDEEASATKQKKCIHDPDDNEVEMLVNNSKKQTKMLQVDKNENQRHEAISDKASGTKIDRKSENVIFKKKNERIKQNVEDNPRIQTFQEEDESASRRNGQVEHETSFGFLTTVNPIEDQICRTKYEKEEDLPTNCVVTEFVTLVSRKKKTTLREVDESVPSGYTKWKGKMVKNFKKFKKAGHAGSNGLPRIIGGSDLEVHIASERKEIDEWFRDALEAESQQSEADQRAAELFEWEPSHTSGRRRGR